LGFNTYAVLVIVLPHDIWIKIFCLSIAEIFYPNDEGAPDFSRPALWSLCDGSDTTVQWSAADIILTQHHKRYTTNTATIWDATVWKSFFRCFSRSAQRYSTTTKLYKL